MASSSSIGQSENQRRPEDQQHLEEFGWVWIREDTQRVSPKVNTYYKCGIITDIRQRLIEVGGQALLDKFTSGCFGHLMRWPMGKACGKALHMLVSREVEVVGALPYDTWFRIGDKNIRFSPREFALMSGFSFGATSFDPHASHAPDNVEAYQSFCGGMPMKAQKLMERFLNGDDIYDPNGELHLRVANVIMGYHMGLGGDDRRIVDPWLWVLVDDLDAWNRFPWGGYSFRVLRNYTSNVKTRGRQLHPKYHFYGPVWVLQVWMFEAIPGLARVIASNVSDSAIPRCLRWMMVTAFKVNLDAHFSEGVICHESIDPEESEEGTHYWRSLLQDEVHGVHYKKPINPIKEGLPMVRRPRPIITPHVSEPSTGRYTYDLRDRAPQKDTGKGKGKRARKQTSSSSSSGTNTGMRSGKSHFMKELSSLVKTELAQQWKDVFFPEIKSFFKDLFKKSSRSSPRRHTQSTRHCPHHDSPIREFCSDDDNVTIPGRHSMPESSWMGEDRVAYSEPRRSVPDSFVEVEPHGVINVDPISTIIPTGAAFGDILHNPEIYAEYSRQSNAYLNDIFSKGQESMIVQEQAQQVRPYGLLPPVDLVDDEKWQLYEAFLEQDQAFVIINRSKWSPPYFRVMESIMRPIDLTVFDVYIGLLIKRLEERVNILPTLNAHNTILLHTDFFRKFGHQINKRKKSKKLTADIIMGINADANIESWRQADTIIIPIVIEDHFFVVRIHMILWTLEVWDSLLWKENVQDEREKILKPFADKFWVILEQGRYWTTTEHSKAFSRNDPLIISFIQKPTQREPVRQHKQNDDFSSGPFALMTIERMISGRPSVAWGNEEENVAVYRRKIARDIFHKAYERKLQDI